MNRKKLKKKSKQLDLYFLLISTIIVLPLIFTYKTIDPNLSPRLLFWNIVILVLALLIIAGSFKRKLNFGFIKLLIFPVFLLYFFITALSTTQAVNPAEGLYDITKTFLSLMLLIIATYIFNQHSNFKTILVKSVVISSLIAAGIGLYQYLDFTTGKADYELFKALYEVKGLMAHKNQYAISLLLMLPFSVYGMMVLKKWWRYISIVSIIAILLNIILLQTRSVWVATLLFIIIIIISLVIATWKHKTVKFSTDYKQILTFISVFIIIGIISFFLFQKSGALKIFKYQTQTIFDLQSDNNQARLKMWESTLQLSADNFFLGVGAGNWKISILPYYKLKYGSKYQNWRRPHNDLLWVLSEKGIFGVISYLLIFILIAIYAIKSLLREQLKENRLFVILMLSGIGSYLTFALFSFPYERSNHQIYLLLMMAGIISIYCKAHQTSGSISISALRKVFIIVFIFIMFSITYSSVLLKSEIYSQKIFVESKKKHWKKIIKYADEAFSRFTTLDSFSLPYHLYKGIGYTRLKKPQKAFESFEIAHKYFPTQISILNNLGSISSMLGKHEKSIFYFKKSLDVFPHYEVSLFNLSKAYYKKGDYTKAYIALLCCNSNNTDAEYTSVKKDLIRRINDN